MKQTSEIDRHTMVRLLDMDQLIKQNVFPSVRYLADKYEVSTRTIQRDIETMRDQLLVNIEYDRKKNGYYYPDKKGLSVPVMGFDNDELIQLFYTTVLDKYGDNSGVKWLKHLTETHLANNEQLNKLVTQHITREVSKDDKQLVQWFIQLLEAIRKKQTVELDYYVEYRQAESKREVEPYHLYYAEPFWYLIAKCRLRNLIRTFLLDNIRHLNLMGNRYQIPASFSVNDVVGNALRVIKGEPVHIKISFNKKLKTQLERKPIHVSQKIVKEDGILFLTLDIDGINEIIPWILSFGSKMEVLKPKELRQAIKEEVKQLSNIYRR